MAIFKQQNTVPFYFGLVVIAILCGLYGIVYWIDNILPKGLTLQDETTTNDTFIAERAQWILRNLTANGPRVTGSYNTEVTTINYLTTVINTIIREVNENQLVELDSQIVSGAFHYGSSINSYTNVQNIVVKLYSGNNSNHSVLVNSHFDSVPTSPGAMDDGINVAAMLEILRILSHSSERPLHNIIFLFNGAEETGLQASHGFITQHKWAKECRVVVNLEAVGSKGKIILFQNGPGASWLLKYYKKVPYPSAQSLAEEIFQKGYILSDTDFRIFRNFGGLVGYDNAFYKDGYRYHTKYDREDVIPPGSYQHVGANILTLIKNLANAPELSRPIHDNEKCVYYDFLGLFLIAYNETIAIILNVVTIAFSVGLFMYSLYDFHLIEKVYTIKYLSISSAAILGSLILASAFVLVLAVILDLLGKIMSWYANQWLIFGLYMIPTISLSGSLLIFIKHETLTIDNMCQIQAHIVRLIWTLLLIIGIGMDVQSVYVLMISILFNSLGFALIHILRWHQTRKKWIIVYVISLLIPTIMFMKISSNLIDVFIPTTARMGSDKNPEIIVAFLSLVLTLLVTLPFVILTNLLRVIRYYYVCLGLIFVVFLILVFTPVGFPYSGSVDKPAPQRHRMLYTYRKFFNESGDLLQSDSGFFFRSEDRNALYTLRSYVKELQNATYVDEDCEKYLMCGVPHYHIGLRTDTTYFVPSLRPNLPEPLTFEVINKTVISSVLRYTITVSGPDKISLYLAPKDNLSVSNISLVESLVSNRFSFENRPVYIINLQFGNGDHKKTFDVDIGIPVGTNHSTTMDISISGIWIHEEKFVKTPQYIALMTQIPDWAHIEPSMAAYYAYVI